MLYRGINKIDDEKNGGRVIPKGKLVQVAAKADGNIKADGTFFAGPCEINTARAHQVKSGLYDGCGISTSRSEDVAVHFATTRQVDGCEFRVDGYVYVINEALLSSANVAAHELPDPLYPHEQEVTLIVNSVDALPDCLIIQKFFVDSDGNKT
jgi:hypothetical protein